jgi:alpha-glucosidase
VVANGGHLRGLRSQLADGNGDGIGDETGPRQRPPYLLDLGVDATCLTQIYLSPMVDGRSEGDVTDRRDFGHESVADFDAMLTAAHDLAIGVIVDVVPNQPRQRIRVPMPLRRCSGFTAAIAVLVPAVHFGGCSPPNDRESFFGGSAWTRVPDGEGRRPTPIGFRDGADSWLPIPVTGPY